MARGPRDTGVFSTHERMIAMRYLRPRRSDGFISVIAIFSFLGIMLGVATLIIVMSVMNGFRTELMAKVLGFSGHAVMFSETGGPLVGYDRITSGLREIDGVTRAIPMVQGQILASTARASAGALVRGVSEADVKTLPSVNNDKLQGTFDGFDGSQGVALGYRLAWQLRISLGDEVTLINPDGPATAFGTAPRMRNYPVVAIFEIGMSEYDKSVIYMPLTEAQDFFSTEDGVSSIELMVNRPDRIDDFVPAIQAKTGSGVQVLTWKRTNQTFFNALQVERNVMFMILTLIILVAAFNIISGLIMLVKDKGGDIAILRTMGVTRGGIQRIFFMTGAAIGVSGTLAGLLLGILIALNVESIRKGISFLTGTKLFPPELYYLSQLPAELSLGQTVWIAVMSLALSFLATLYPAWRAARLDPVEALRYE